MQNMDPDLKERNRVSTAAMSRNSKKREINWREEERRTRTRIEGKFSFNC